MRFAESHDPCRYCGSTQIVIWPPSSAGQCAGCSDAVRAYEARLGDLADRKLALARAAFAAAEEQRRVAERLRQRAARRAALIESGLALFQRGTGFGSRSLRRLQATLQKAAPHRSRTA